MLQHELFFSLFSTLTATVQLGYSSCNAETTAGRIGVLNERGESHSESSGYFYVSRTLNGRRWMGGRKAAGTPRSRYANPVQLPPTPIGVGGRFYQTNRSRTMHTNQTSVPTSLAQLKAQLAAIALIVHANRCGVAK